MGAADMISVWVRSTIVQLATPDDMRGRVSAVHMLFVGTSNEFGDFRARTVDFEQDVNAVALMIDFISKLPAAHHFRLGNAAALIGDDLLRRFREAHHLGIFSVRINNKNYFVRSFFCHSNPPS